VSCAHGKIPYATRGKAEKALRRMHKRMRQRRPGGSTYQCRECGEWHISHHERGRYVPQDWPGPLNRWIRQQHNVHAAGACARERHEELGHRLVDGLMRALRLG
jgi:hypothetical protein